MKWYFLRTKGSGSRGPQHSSKDRILQRSASQRRQSQRSGVRCSRAARLVTSSGARPRLLWVGVVPALSLPPLLCAALFPLASPGAVFRAVGPPRSHRLFLCHCSLAAGLAAPTRSELLLRAMSRPSSVSPRPPAPSGGGPGGGGGGGPASCGPGGGGRAKGLKDIRIDEEVKIAVNIALERFRYGDQRGEASDGGPCGLTPARRPAPDGQRNPGPGPRGETSAV